MSDLRERTKEILDTPVYQALLNDLEFATEAIDLYVDAFPETEGIVSNIQVVIFLKAYAALVMAAVEDAMTVVHQTDMPKT